MMSQTLSNSPNNQDTTISLMMRVAACVSWSDKKLYQLLAENTMIVYIKTNKEAERVLIERSKNQPKPVYYHPDFFDVHTAGPILKKTAWTMLPK